MVQRIAIIGAGISGIASAHVFQKRGYEVIIYEKSDTIGGVWAEYYPDVSLQNTYHQYHISDFPWTKQPDLHPTSTQIMDYFRDAVTQLKLDVRLNHSVDAMRELEMGWELDITANDETLTQVFDFVIIAIGQYTGRKKRLKLAGQEQFTGRIITEVDIEDLSELDNQAVVVVGFGKSALDMATFAAERGAEVHHVFRTPRWTVPNYLFGIHYSRAFFSRFGSMMMTSWVHGTPTERALHKNAKFLVDSFWKMIESLFGFLRDRYANGLGADAKQRLAIVTPQHRIGVDLRSAVALAPLDYYPYVAQGKIQPYHAELDRFTETGIALQDGRSIDCDVVIASIGSNKPVYPFLPQKYRDLLEGNDDGTQLYRHLIHPQINRVGFAGYNHGFMHIPSAEVGALWLSAWFANELELPSRAEMQQTIDYVTDWKRTHISYEPSLLNAVNARFQQYLDVILQDLGLEHRRKKGNPLAETFQRYGASDYAGIVEEYEANLQKHTTTALNPLPLHT